MTEGSFSMCCLEMVVNFIWLSLDSANRTGSYGSLLAHNAGVFVDEFSIGIEQLGHFETDS